LKASKEPKFLINSSEILPVGNGFSLAFFGGARDSQ